MSEARPVRTYLDWNATTPPLEAVRAAMAEAACVAWANPASIHEDGRRARALVEGARAAVAELTAVDPRDVVLTSGGTEANNLALRSMFGAGAGTLITSRLEHPSITRVAEAFAAKGAVAVRWLRVLPEGVVDLEDLERALAEAQGPLGVALQAVNHETGVVQPVDAAIALTHGAGGRIHVDAVQALGRMTPTDGIGAADSLSLASHKLRGPKGIGALVVRPGTPFVPLLLGGAQERGLRPGTVDPVACAGLRVAAENACSAPARYAAKAVLRDALEAAIARLDAAAIVNGAGAVRAPHVANVSFSGWNGPELVAALDLEGVSVSSGSACSAGTVEASPVVTAMAGARRAASAVRFSLGEDTGPAEIDEALEALGRVLARATFRRPPGQAR